MFKENNKPMGLRFLKIVHLLILSVCFGVLQASASEMIFASPIPWSGSWWPFREGGIGTGLGYRGHPAPLEKYLLYTTGGTSGPALTWYLANYYDPAAEDWWGLCPAYARSAVKETYPILPSVHDNIVFRVGDKKGLLAICHDSRDGIIYASAANPVNFHLWLLDYIKDQKRAFAADLNLGEEVWYFPVYGYTMTTTARSGRSENIEVFIYYAAHDIPDYMGTAQREKGPYTYTLDLDAEGNIVGGRWTGDSIADHPKTLSYPETTGPVNPYLTQTDCEQIREIAQARDDELEPGDNSPVRLLPGYYHLVLLNPDCYEIYGGIGDVVTLDVFRENGSVQDMRAVITDAEGEVIWDCVFDKSDDPESFVLNLVNPPYTLTFTQDAYETDPNIYSLTMNYHGVHVREAPYIPKDGSWFGFALTNASADTVAEVTLMTLDGEGKPLRSVFGPQTIAPRMKALAYFASVPAPAYEILDTESMKLITDQEVHMVNLFGADAGPMAGFSGAGVVGDRIIIPDLYDNEPGDPQYIAGAMQNMSFAATEVDVNIYAAEGDLLRKAVLSFPALGRAAVKPGSAPFFNIEDGGWLEVAARNPGARLSGYQYLSDRKNKGNILDTLFALPVADGTLYVQHITPPEGPWETLLTLINPHDAANTATIRPARPDRTESPLQISLGPREKKCIAISPDFGTSVRRSILEVRGRLPLSGYLSLVADNGDAAFYPLLTDGDFKPELIMPHAPYNQGRWYTGVGICNPNAHSVTVLMTPYDHSGEILLPAGVDLTLPPGGYEVFTLSSMFPKMDADISFLTISSEGPDFAPIGGFYLYCNGDGRDLPPRVLASGGNM